MQDEKVSFPQYHNHHFFRMRFVYEDILDYQIQILLLHLLDIQEEENCIVYYTFIAQEVIREIYDFFEILTFIRLHLLFV